MSVSKDIQIAEKDKQIAQLMEQAKNYQVLLQAQQVLSLPAPKRSFFKRLFGIHEEKEGRLCRRSSFMPLDSEP